MRLEQAKARLLDHHRETSSRAYDVAWTLLYRLQDGIHVRDLEHLAQLHSAVYCDGSVPAAYALHGAKELAAKGWISTSPVTFL